MAKSRITYNEINIITNGLIGAINAVNESKGYTTSDNAYYTVGYIQSLLNHLISEMPVTKQHRVVDYIQTHTASKISKLEA